MVDISALGGNGEAIPGGTVAADTSGFRVTPPGEYLSLTRTVKAKQIKEGAAAGHYEFLIGFANGLVDQESQKTLQTRFLDKKITTIPFTLTDYETGQPLINPATGQPKQSTSVATYLSAFGFDTKNMDLQKAIQWVQESLSTPVVVVINWNDKAKKGADGKWTNGGLRKVDFQVGTAPDGTPLYSETVEKNGVLYEAKAVVSYFKKSA